MFTPKNTKKTLTRRPRPTRLPTVQSVDLERVPEFAMPITEVALELERGPIRHRLEHDVHIVLGPIRRPRASSSTESEWAVARAGSRRLGLPLAATSMFAQTCPTLRANRACVRATNRGHTIFLAVVSSSLRKPR